MATKIDLKTKGGRETWETVVESDYEGHSTILDYLKDGKFSRIVSGNARIFAYPNRSGYLTVIDNAVYDDDYYQGIPDGIIVESDKYIGFKKIMLINADQGSNILIDELNFGMPCVSFTCLARFVDDPKRPHPKKLLDLFAKGDLILVDFTADQTRKATNAEKKELSKLLRHGRSFPTKDGFTYINGKWHRPSTVLIRDTRENGKSILLGQDENTYFGCELQDRPKTVKEAFISLMPPEARGKKSVMRQGEWFAVPVQEKEVPKFEETIGFMTNDPYDVPSIVLPIEHADSNLHRVIANEIRIAKDGTIFACNFTVSHEQHADLTASLWAKFVRNTALRSFSEEGVD